MIELDDVRFTYTGRKSETLQGVSLHIQEGETVLLLGASGSGKSTLACCLNGLIPHNISGTFEGCITVAGQQTGETSVAMLAQQVGIVFQNPEAQAITSRVEDEVAFGLENLSLPVDEMEERISSALQQVDMLDRRMSAIDTLSGGGKQRLAIASLLAMRPRVLVFDEPTANLDPLGTQEIFAAIAQLKRSGRYTIVLIEHKLDALMHLIDRVIVLGAGGTVLLEGEPHAVFRDHAATLLKHGIWMPQVALLAHRLREQGWQWEPFPITQGEAIRSWKQAPLQASPRIELSSSSTTPSNTAGRAIEVRHLAFAYGTRPILDDISLRVPQGDFLAIVGANGAGKTTLAHHLVDIIRPPRSKVFLHGHDITRLSARSLIEQAGYVFQNPEHQFVTNSVAEELCFSLRLQKLSRQEIERRVESMLAQFGLSRYARANPFTLSHGEKRRLSVATMLIMGQRILLLDEPTFGQDQRNAHALLEHLRLLHNQGHTILVITHDMALVAEYAQHVAVLNNGQLLYHGPTAQLFAQPQLLRQAHLTPPPLAQLSQQLATECHPVWQGLSTLDQFLSVAASQMEVTAS